MNFFASLKYYFLLLLERVKDQKILKDLRGVNFSGAVLDNESFKKFDLEEVNLANCSLINVSFREANLVNANLRNTDISGAIFDQANLSGADLRNSQGWETATFKDCIYNENTLSHFDLN